MRCAVNVSAPGKTSLALNSADGISLWIDGKPQKAQSVTPLDLPTGHHNIDFWIDLTSRKAETLRVEIVPVADSTAHLDWAGG